MTTTQAIDKQGATDQREATASHHSSNTDGGLLQLVTFVVGSEEYAISILSVQEINRMMQITRVPQSPPFIEGVINLRGKVIPVMDLRKRFGLTPSTDTGDARIIVVEVAGRVIGFTVDRVNEVLRIDSAIVEPPPALASGANSDYIQGVGKLDDRLLILLDIERLLSSNEIDIAQRVAEVVAAA